MGDKARFDQLENLLVDLARKQDRQSEQIAKIFEALIQQGEALAQHGEALTEIGKAVIRHEEALTVIGKAAIEHGEAIARLEATAARQDVRLDNLSEQIDDVINILKLSAARHIETERRQDAMMEEIKMQSKRQDVAVEALRALLKRQETTDTRLDSAVQTQLQMLQLMHLNSTKTDAQEPRLTRLEGEVFGTNS